MNPVLWMLVAATGATVALLIERRRKTRELSLDAWAESQGRPVIREVELSILSEVEPLALLPDVFGIERFLPARAESEAALFLCHCGRGHRPESVLLAVLAAPDWLPHLRILHHSVRDVPSHLGYVEKESAALPPAYRVEAFAELDSVLLQAVASTLPYAGPPLRIELRPGRILVAMDRNDGDSASQLGEHSQALLRALLSTRA